MNIKQLETFVRIVELGSFQAAAADLYASPSTISTRIKELERYLGLELFDHSFHKAQPTARGQDFFGRAKQLVEFTSSLSRQVRSPHATTGLVRLGAVGLAASTWLTDLVAAMRQDYPGVSLRVEVCLTRQLVERLSTGKLDFAIVVGGGAEHGLHVEPLGSEEFVWMQRPGTASSRQGAPLGPSDLASRPVLMLTEDSHHHPIVRQWFRDAGVHMEPVAMANTMTVLARMAMPGLGVALLPRHAFRDQLAAGELEVVPTAPALAPVPMSLLYRQERVPELADVLVRLVRLASDLPEPPQPPR
jgi:DNA-binding transcriptional LysR family regulator